MNFDIDNFLDDVADFGPVGLRLTTLSGIGMVYYWLRDVFYFDLFDQLDVVDDAIDDVVRVWGYD